MALSYEFSVGSVSAKEKSLLTQTDIQQMIACQSADELCRFLADKGYGEGENVDEILVDHTKKLWKYLESITPDFDIFAPFIIQNDIHNLKVVLKGIMSSREYDDLLVKPRNIEPEVLKEAVEKRRFNLLPEWLSESADKAYETLAHTGDARFGDAVLDNAAMKQMLVLSTQYSRFLKQYFETYVFYSNIKIALRSARTGTTKEFLNKALTEVDGFKKKEVTESAVKGQDALIEMLSKCDSYGCDKAMEEFKNSPVAFERFVDNRLILLTKEYCKNKNEGAEPLLGYFLANKNEEVLIHIIESGIRTSTDREIIRERLREIYG